MVVFVNVTHTDMSRKLILFVTTVLFLGNSYAQRDKRFFRKDYHYIDAVRNFYKIHTIPKSWEQARKTCVREGATLFYPINDTEANAVIEYWSNTHPFNWIFIGVASRFAKGSFATIEGIPIDEVYNNWAPWEPNNAGGVEDCVVLGKLDKHLNDDNCDKKLNFICKKSFASLEWNEKCDIPDNSYIYNEDLGKCYKFYMTPMNWSEAYSVCSNEQSYLSIINHQEEAKYFAKLIQQAPKEKVLGPYLSGAVHLGFHNLNGDGWYTIKGKSLDDVGYTRWGNQQPDGGSNELCGSMFYDGTLNDIACDQKCFFICERESKDDIDIKFGEFF